MSSPSERPQARVLALISQLLRRPARTDRRLPLIWLNGGGDGTRVLGALVAQLTPPVRYRVPHAYVDMTKQDAPRDIRQLLRMVCMQLAAPRFGSERLSFRHYELVDWLMGRDLSGEASGDRARAVVALLRGRHRPFRRHNDGFDSNAFDLGPSYRLLIWLIRRVMPEMFFRTVVSGRIPGFGRRYRWFMRQQYLAPLQSVNFPGFAERLTVGVRQYEDIDQVDKLLVHAFLQDLRRAYARRLRLEGWRRTTYPVALIDKASEGSAGYRLMQLVNDVRNETGQSDQLLVVCASEQVPQAPAKANVAESDSGKLLSGDPAYADEDYRKWAKKLPGSRRARVDTAWYLPISVTDSEDPDQDLRKPIGATPPPWFARRSVVGAVIVVLALFVVGGTGWKYAGVPGCPHIPFLGQVEVRSIDGQCIGYSDSNYFLFNDESGQERLRQVQNTIFEQNETVLDLWKKSNRTRPYVTIVYLAALTGRPAAKNEEAYAAEREELEGLAVAQYDATKKPASSSEAPLLNIVIANGGFQLEHASQAVDMIADLRAKDLKVVSVIGMGESRTSTADALKKLNEIGLPLIGPVTSADNFYQNSRLYLQLAAPNRDNARMIGEYSKQVLKIPDARLYWTVGTKSSFDQDLYVKTLVNDLEDILPREFEIGVDNRGRFDGSLNRDVCGYPGVLIFAGRWTEFPSFLHAIDDECSSNPPAHVIADGSVERYMENPTLRSDAPSNIPVTYVSVSTLGSCEFLQAAQITGKDPVRDRFLRLIQQPGLLQPPRCGPDKESAGSRDALEYDAVMIIIRAVENLGQELRRDSSHEWDPHSILPVAVHAKIVQQIHDSPFGGVSGIIKFDGDSGEPTDKRISLLKVEKLPDVQVRPVEVFHCGRVYPGDDPKCRQR
jgi:ABC-type branched-subunit amino acid transport system substrate-binding protein